MTVIADISCGSSQGLPPGAASAVPVRSCGWLGCWRCQRRAWACLCMSISPLKWLAVVARCHLPVSGSNVEHVRTALYAPVQKQRLRGLSSNGTENLHKLCTNSQDALAYWPTSNSGGELPVRFGATIRAEAVVHEAGSRFNRLEQVAANITSPSVGSAQGLCEVSN
mgnify:CR=1 FL=1